MFLRILGCLFFQKNSVEICGMFAFSIVVEDLGMFKFSNMLCLRLLSICLIPNWCLGTLSVLFWCQTKVFGVSPSVSPFLILRNFRSPVFEILHFLLPCFLLRRGEVYRELAKQL